MIDSHAHYNDEKFDIDRDEILKKCIDHGVTHIINAGCDLKSSEMSIALSSQYPFVYAAVGVHPHELSSCGDDTLDALAELSKHKKVVAVGEIGLDYHYDFSPREVQKDWFAKQINLARKLKLPIIVHDREAHRDVLDIVRAERGYEVGGVFHCFSGSREMAEEVIGMGFKIGIGGALTFKNAHRSIEVVRYTPLDMLLVETDCPYLAPEPHRGKRNWSGLIEIIISKIAQIKEMDYDTVCQATTNNAINLFKL